MGRPAPTFPDRIGNIKTIRWTREGHGAHHREVARQTLNVRLIAAGPTHSFSVIQSETRVMRQIDLHKLADDAHFNRFHGLVLFWCALIIVFDGYDLSVVGIALPSIMTKMGVD